MYVSIKKCKVKMGSMSLREKKKILELARIISSLDETQIKNLIKIVDNDSYKEFALSYIAHVLRIEAFR